MFIKLSSPAQIKNLVNFSAVSTLGMELTKAKDALLLSHPTMVALSGKDAGVPIDFGIMLTNKPIRLIFGHTTNPKYNLLISPTPLLASLPISISYASVLPAHVDGQISLTIVAHKQCEILESLPLVSLLVFG